MRATEVKWGLLLCFLLVGCSFAADYGQGQESGMKSASSVPPSQERKGIKTARDLYDVCRQALKQDSFYSSACDGYIAGFIGGLVIMEAHIYPRISRMDCSKKEKDIAFHSKGSYVYCVPGRRDPDLLSLPFIASWIHDHPGHELQNSEVAALSFVK